MAFTERRGIMRIGLCLLALALAAGAGPAGAAFHLFRIDQVYSNADGSAQYVVMREVTGSNGENFWAGNSLSTTSAGGAQQFQFPSNLPSSATASRSVLIATRGFAALGLIAPDYTVPDRFIPQAGGSVSYANGTDAIPLPALPTDGVTAIDRNGNRVAATPKNFAGASVTLTAPPAGGSFDPDQQGLTGSWYEPATSGQGIELEVYPDFVASGTGLVAGAWFTFDGAPAGGVDRQRWFTFSGNAQSVNPGVSITIFRNVGGNFDAPPVTTSTMVGSGTLTFSDCATATLAYSFSDGSGRSGTIPLARITPNVTCTTGAAASANADFGFSGNWYDASTSGQGFLFEVNPLVPVFFFAWYTYAPAGQAAGAAGQRWFTGQGPYSPGSRTIVVPLYETTGGLFDQPSMPPPSTVPVGTATVTFASCSSAQLQFSFTGGSNAGRSGSISLSRVGPVPAGCPQPATGMTTYMPPGGYGPP